MKRAEKTAYRSYFLAGVVTLAFFLSVLAYMILLVPKEASFLGMWVYLLPLSPIGVVWLYFLFKALIPVTGGMPGKGFKQWFLGYLFLLFIWIYLAGVAFALDLIFPASDRYFTEMIVPSFITAITLFALSLNHKFTKFMKRLFETEGSGVQS